jgi:hypothetical protein
MPDIIDIVARYVAVWNEADAEERRRRIRAAWIPDGTTCYRLLNAQGYEAIETRVTNSWDKWLSEGKYVFRPQNTACHHDVVKFDWVMVTRPGGEVEASGLSFLVLTPDGRIRHDYQFNPSVNDGGDVVKRYLAVSAEPAAGRRRRLVRELWASDGAYITDRLASSGVAEIDAAITQARTACAEKGLISSPAIKSQAHHHVAWLQLPLQAENGDRPISAVSHLLILDEGGRIRLDYCFEEPA